MQADFWSRGETKISRSDLDSRDILPGFYMYRVIPQITD